MIRNFILVLGLFFFDLNPLWAQVAQGEFESFFGAAKTGANKRLEATHLKPKPVAVTGPEAIATNAPAGAWRFILSGWGKAGGWFGDEVPVQYLAAVVENYGSYFQYTFMGPDIPSAALDWMEAEGKLASEKKDILNDIDDVQTTFSRNGGRLVMVSKYDYKHGKDDIPEKLEDLFTASRGIIIETLQQMDKAIDEGREKAAAAPLKFLKKSDVVLLANDGLEKTAPAEDTAGPEGYWSFGRGDVWYYVANKGNVIELYATIKLPKRLSDAEVQTVIAKGKEWMTAQPYKEGTNHYVGPFMANPEWGQASIFVPFDGKITGKQFNKIWHDFLHDYAPKALKQTVKVVEGL